MRHQTRSHDILHTKKGKKMKTNDHYQPLRNQLDTSHQTKEEVNDVNIVAVTTPAGRGWGEV